MGINIKDVANKAGVSVSTVSRAFTRPELVSKATRAKVLAIAEELDFLILPLGHGAQVRPRAARGFADERSHSSMVQRFDHRRAEPGVPRERL